MSDNGIWADKFIKREQLPAGELAQRFNINNPRLHPESQRAATESSLDTVGWIDEVSLSTNGDGSPSLTDNPDAVLFDGHERVEIALVRGGPDMLVPVRWYQLTPEETDFALLVKDQSAAMAQIDPEKMGALMERAKAMTTAPGLQGMLERLKNTQTMVLGKGDFVDKSQRAGSSPWERIEPSNKVRCLVGDIEFGVDKEVVGRWFVCLKDTGDPIKDAAEKWFLQNTL